LLENLEIIDEFMNNMKKDVWKKMKIYKDDLVGDDAPLDMMDMQNSRVFFLQ
jgi:hypothetical protein